MYLRDQQRASAENGFMKSTDPDTQKAVETIAADVLLKETRKGEQPRVWRRHRSLLCTSPFISGLFYQIPRRAHRNGQENRVNFYILQANIIIKRSIDDKRQKKSHVHCRGIPYDNQEDQEKKYRSAYWGWWSLVGLRDEGGTYGWWLETPRLLSTYRPRVPQP